MKVVDKRTPRWHPQHTKAPRYYRGQQIANNYVVDNPHANGAEYNELFTKIYNGLILKFKDSGLKEGEVVINGK
jgi:hypothetical protein